LIEAPRSVAEKALIWRCGVGPAFSLLKDDRQLSRRLERLLIPDCKWTRGRDWDPSRFKTNIWWSMNQSRHEREASRNDAPKGNQKSPQSETRGSIW